MASTPVLIAKKPKTASIWVTPPSPEPSVWETHCSLPVLLTARWRVEDFPAIPRQNVEIQAEDGKVIPMLYLSFMRGWRRMFRSR